MTRRAAGFYGEGYYIALCEEYSRTEIAMRRAQGAGGSMTNIEQELLEVVHSVEPGLGHARAASTVHRVSKLLARAREALAAVQARDAAELRCPLCSLVWLDGREPHAPDCPMRLVSAALKALEEA